MQSLESIRLVLEPLFPGLMGVRVVELSSERVVAELVVRPDLCTAGAILHGGAHMAFADTLGVIGPTRMAYDRMIQIVDITSRLVSNALSQK